MTYVYDPKNPPPRPPHKLWKPQLKDILAWYEENLCELELFDPRGKMVKFSPERFPHLIKLMDAESGQEVRRPQNVIEAIRSGEKCNDDFGGFDDERAKTLPWIPIVVKEPSQILEVVEPTLWEKPGDTLIVKEFEKQGYRNKVLVCRRVGSGLLVPITSHPSDKKGFGKSYKKVWP
jgi:hypothetical protein